MSSLEALSAERERHIENVLHMLSEDEIVTKVMFMCLKEIEYIFIKWTWFWNVRIVVKNHKD